MQGPYLRKYGVETTIDFHLYEVDGVNLRVDAAHVAGDTKLMKDEGAEANTTNGFTDEGQGYSIVLTATEMEAARIVLYVVDAATKVWLDEVVVIETYGHASAMHAFDLDTASVAQTGDSYARLGAPAAASVSADIAVVDGIVDDIVADTNELQTDDVPGLIAALNDLSSTDVQTVLEANDLDHLIQVSAGAEEPTDGSYLDQMMHTDAGQTFDPTTDSLEAIRDRGDAAWITGGGGSISDILNVQVLIPFAIDLANTATVRIGLGLTNMLDDLPSTAEITPGTIAIDRKAIGGTSWTNVVNDAACSELAGLIYYDEVFDSGTGYAAGDSIRITFKGQKINVAANDYEITGTDGWMFETYIREAMRGTDSAALASALSTHDGKLDTVDGIVDTILADTDELQTDDVPGLIAALNDLSAAAVNAEVDTALNTAIPGSPTADSVNERVATMDDLHVYQAKVWAFDDETNTTDRYVCAFHKDGEPITSGITNPQIQVIKAADGTDLIAATAMSQIGSTGLYKKDEATNRMVNGAAYMAKVTATIDGATRTWYQPVGRDSSAA